MFTVKQIRISSANDVLRPQWLGTSLFESFSFIHLYLGRFLANGNVSRLSVDYVVPGAEEIREANGVPPGWLKDDLQQEWERFQFRILDAALAVEALDRSLKKTAGAGFACRLMKELTLSLHPDHLICTDEGYFVLTGWGLNRPADSVTPFSGGVVSAKEFLKRFAEVHRLPVPDAAIEQKVRTSRKPAPVRTSVSRPAPVASSATPPSVSRAAPGIVEDREPARKSWVLPVVFCAVFVLSTFLGWGIAKVFPSNAAQNPVESQPCAEVIKSVHETKPLSKSAKFSVLGGRSGDASGFALFYEKTPETFGNRYVALFRQPDLTEEIAGKYKVRLSSGGNAEIGDAQVFCAVLLEADDPWVIWSDSADIHLIRK